MPAALLALAPKCVVCVLGYAGLGATLGLSAPELCGDASDSLASWLTRFAWLGTSGILIVAGLLANSRRRQSRI
jgi:hypothetical protein